MVPSTVVPIDNTPHASVVMPSNSIVPGQLKIIFLNAFVVASVPNRTAVEANIVTKSVVFAAET